MMKFALFLVCALVAVQGFQARSVDPNERALSDVIDAIKKAIEQIKQIVENITSQLPQIIENLKNKIKEALGRVEEIVNELEDKIKELVALGEAGRKCAEAQKGEIDALVALAKSGVQGCITEAEGKTEALNKQIEALAAKANALRDDIVARTVQCLDENKLNPVALVNCLKKQVDPIREQVEEVGKEVANTIEVAKQTAEAVSESLTSCSQKVAEDVANKETEILNNIKDCIQNS